MVKTFAFLLLVGVACHKPETYPAPIHPLPATARLLPSTISGSVGDTIPLGANLDVDGRTVSCAPVKWQSLTPSVASVELVGPTGAALVVHTVGSSVVKASCGGLSQAVLGTFEVMGSAERAVPVRASPRVYVGPNGVVGRLMLDYVDVHGAVGDTLPLGAYATRDGEDRMPCRPMWTSSDSRIASVEPVGETDHSLVVHDSGTITLRVSCGELQEEMTRRFVARHGDGK